MSVAVMWEEMNIKKKKREKKEKKKTCTKHTFSKCVKLHDLLLGS